MKKILMGASALALASVAGTADAQTWNVRLSGGAVTGGAFVDTSVANESYTIFNRYDATITGTLVADNGLTFTSRFVLTNQGNGNFNEDGYSVAVAGTFGQVIVGRGNGAARMVLPRIPRGTFVSAGSGAGTLFSGDYSANQVPARLQDDRGATTGFGTKVTYMTPRIAGFQAGASWSPGDANASGGRAARNVGGSDISQNFDNEGFEIGGNYTNTFGAFRVAAGIGYTNFTSSNQTGNLRQGGAVSLNVGFDAFDVGVSYAVHDYRSGTNTEVLAVGGRYRTGPWTFAGSFGMNMRGEANGRAGGEPIAAGNTSTSQRDRRDDFGLAGEVNYALAPGVTTGVSAEYSRSGRTVTTAEGSDRDAFAVGLFLGLRF